MKQFVSHKKQIVELFGTQLNKLKIYLKKRNCNTIQHFGIANYCQRQKILWSAILLWCLKNSF